MRMRLPRFLTGRPAAHDEHRFGFAVVGLGHGAKKFTEALAGSADVHVAAIVSGDTAKADRFAHNHDISRVFAYEDFDKLADDPAVDAVYLCLPNKLHAEFAVRAATLGKHVLCEKPLAANVADAERMIRACHAANRLLMTGYRLDFDPAHREAQHLIAAGALGEIRSVRSGFGFIAKPGWRLDPTLAGGGSLYDVGTYCVHALHELFGSALTIESASVLEDSATGLELDCTWRTTLPGGAVAECRSSYVERIPDHLHITGERGSLTLEPAFGYEGARLRGEFYDRLGKKQVVNITTRRSPSLFRLEAEHLAHCARTGEALRSPGEAGLRDLQTLAQIETVAAHAPTR